ncbi:MAG: hypothetical protein Q7S27_04335 [Nanoarchaeota archaeon]|nr:hypothetical protein [Nanoarchaeota archaeon]
MPSTKEILDKYSKKLETQVNSSPGDSEKNYSEEYSTFKKEMIPELSRYERFAKSLGNIIKIKIAEKDRKKIQPFLDTARLDVSSSEVISLSFISMLGIFFLSMLISLAIYFYTDSFPTPFLFMGLLTSTALFYHLKSMPKRLANAYRLQASSQMVPAILYTVVYMKHTSNLERAIHFASEHLEGPLALDFKKIFYDVEIGKFSTIKQSLDAYLETWQDYAPEFIESFHLIESSLFEPSESRRVIILEKSLQVILDGVYEKMLKYSREIRSPLTNVYMLGIILPTLGLALLPLASTLLGGIIQWYHVAILFNILIPVFVFYLVSEALLKRPGGYGQSQIIELSPDYEKFKSRKPWIRASLIALPLLIIGLLPFLFQISAITNLLGIESDYSFSQIGIPFLGNEKLFDFKIIEDVKVGPFGPLAVLLSLFLPLSVAVFFSSAYKQKTKSLIKSREDTKILEEEFTNSIFQLGNRLGDGVPAEIAFSYVAQSTKSQKTHEFFSLVNQNIQQGGMSLESAIFNKKRGALVFFPSPLIATSMKILVESAKKGLQVAARSLMAISDYVKNINRINQRLRDLLAEIITDMKSNMTFLAPLLAGIVVGLSAMITSILNKLQTFQAELNNGSSVSNLANIANLFQVDKMIPPYFLQVIIGIYLVQIVFILTSALITVESGKDLLKEKYELAKNLKRSLTLYLITALFSILALTILSVVALGPLSP